MAGAHPTQAASCLWGLIRGECNVKLTLPRFGSEEVEIDPDTLIEFPDGLPGFEDCKRFKLFHSGENPVIFWLQSVDDAGVVFSLTDPGLLKIFYELTLTDEEEGTLCVTEGDELNIAVILSQGEKSHTAAVQPNLRSPIVINISKRIALQKSLQDAELPTCT